MGDVTQHQTAVLKCVFFLALERTSQSREHSLFMQVRRMLEVRGDSAPERIPSRKARPGVHGHLDITEKCKAYFS